ncbi:MAG: hypothetical protein K0R38_5022 [Polyangiaceae bacterium]|jgi:hypothetical protein|nr:hypothetical protein [Polyangiaceae bacterium]
MKSSDSRPLFQLLGRDIDEKLHEVVLRVAELIGPAAPALLDRAGLARALSCSSKHVDRLRREGMPVVMLGDVPRFSLAEVLRWLRERSRTPELRVVRGAD